MNVVDKYQEVFDKYSLKIGRLISFSKSFYRHQNPKNFVIFNANILTQEDGKIWWGDLDITVDEDNLKKIAKDLGKTLYVLRELEYRFVREKDPIEIAIRRAVWNSEET